MSNLLKMMAGGAAPLYVDDVFSTYTYTGNGSTQTITNGIDLAGRGGLVWIKSRSQGSTNYIGNNIIYGSAIAYDRMYSNATQAAGGGNVITVSSTGFTTEALAASNYSGDSFVSWTFRNAPKFFDVVTYTGNSVAGRAISHSLGQAPGMIVIKRTNSTGAWIVYHRSTGATKFLELNTTAAEVTDTKFNDTSPTSSVFYVGNDASVNGSGSTYVAYLFAHDTTTDGIIQCGSFTTDGSGNATVTLGWEPQWILLKNTGTGGEDWWIFDSIRGWPVAADGDCLLRPNLSAAEYVSSGFDYGNPTATGFTSKQWGAGKVIAYVAIRRPNKPPTSGTQVYSSIARTGTGAAATVTGVGFAPDLVVYADRSHATNTWNAFQDSLRGFTNNLTSNETATETSVPQSITARGNDGVSVGTHGSINANAITYINHFFRRAPGVFDVVCYTGTGSATTVTHNLGVVPELIITKVRAGGPPDFGWAVYSSPLGATKALFLDTTDAKQTLGAYWNDTAPTSSVFTVGNANKTNRSSYTYVAYLFATKASVSKVGSYTGNGSNQAINCGFTTGARFALIKRTDSTGDWYIWDTVRGIVAGNDPHLSLNTTSAEVTTDDSIDADTSGFIVNQDAATNINVNTATYIFLAFA